VNTDIEVTVTVSGELDDDNREELADTISNLLIGQHVGGAYITSVNVDLQWVVEWN